MLFGPMDREMSPSESYSVLQMFIKAGPLIIPVILCLLVSVGIFWDKWQEIVLARKDIERVRKKIIDLVKAGQVKEAIEFCDIHPSLYSDIIKAGLLQFGTSKESIVAAMEEKAHFEIPRLESSVPILGVIANVSPLIGLLGTFLGLTTLYFDLGRHYQSFSPLTVADLSRGIGQALLISIFSIATAIIAFLGYNFLVHQIHRLTLDLEFEKCQLAQYLSALSSVKTIPTHDPSEELSN